MAPLPPPSAASEPPHHSKTPGGVLLCSAFRHLPFALPLLPSKPSVLDHHPLEIRPSLLAAVDRCFKDWAAVVSEHPFLKPLLSLHSNLQSICQARCRSSRIAFLPHSHNFAAVLPGDSVAGLVVANGINNFLNLYNTLLVIRLVLTWFPNSPPAIVSPLSTICDPYLNIFRGIIPPLGGTLDLSPILAFLVLNAFTSTAAALPAELPRASTAQQNIADRHRPFSLTTTQEKWMRRLCCKKSDCSEEVK